MKTDTISVIVITYNQRKYIQTCLDSILSQRTSARMEILVGDDASEDGTAAVVADCARVYPERLYPSLRKKNMGASANIKDLIEQARGDYIAFCEGDDFWTDIDKLERQKEALQAHPEWFGCVHDTVLVDEEGTPMKSQNLQWVQARDVFTLRDFDLSSFPGHISSLMIRNNSAWKKINKGLLLCDRNKSDRMLMLMALSQGNIGHISGEMSAYRFVRSMTGHNLTATVYREKISDVLTDMKMCVWMERWLKENGFFSKKFVNSQSQLLVTALFHLCKGYNVPILSIWRLCNHKIKAVCLLPVAFAERLLIKMQIVLKQRVR